jgi:non-heme chloroperoxidase
MPYIAVAEDNSAPIDLYYEDHGAGPAVVLVHGFPTSGRSWEKQVIALYRAGFRVVAYDRRGFGRSSMPAFGYDFDTLAADLHALIATLELRDVTLVGCGMGGGEVARYFGLYGADRVHRAAFVSSITPALYSNAHSFEAIDATKLLGKQQEIEADRFSFARRFIADAYNAGSSASSIVTSDVLERDADIAATASLIAMSDSVAAWSEDFGSDLAQINVPSLVIHGDCDRIAPMAITARRMPTYLDKAALLVLEGAPHAIIWTHAALVNTALLNFLR